MAGSTTTSTLGSLKKARRGKIVALRTRPQGKITPTPGIGRPTGKSAASKGGGLASPLREVGRTSYADTLIYSSDGILSFVYRPLKQGKYKDANNLDIIINYMDPSNL
jgi:hypothetical protein